MRVKTTIIIFLFYPAFFLSWGQGIDDIFRRKKEAEKEKKSTTLAVDTDIQRSVSSAELEKTKQDSIKQINKKWENYLTEKNNAIKQILITIGQVDEAHITKEKTSEFKFQVDCLKGEIDARLQSVNRECWEDNLFGLESSLRSSCNLALLKIEEWNKTTDTEPDKPNWLLILGIGFGAFMIIFNQLKSFLMKIKVKKMQELQSKKQREEIERQMLLVDENNIVTLK